MEEDNIAEAWLESVTVFIALIAIAEANVFGIVTDYYKLFHKSDEKSWKVAHAITFSQKSFLFCHAFFSVGANLLARTFLTNGVIMYFKQFFSTIFVTMAFFFVHTVIRQFIFYIARVLKYAILKETMPSTLYESFNYGWRSAILSTDFQSDSKVRQFWFYFENAFGFLVWYAMILKGHGPFDTHHIGFLIFSGLFFLCFCLSIILLLLTRYYLKLNTIQDFLFKSKTLFTQSIIGITKMGSESNEANRRTSQNSQGTLDKKNMSICQKKSFIKSRLSISQSQETVHTDLDGLNGSGTFYNDTVL